MTSQKPCSQLPDVAHTSAISLLNLTEPVGKYFLVVIPCHALTVFPTFSYKDFGFRCILCSVSKEYFSAGILTLPGTT